MRQNHWSVRDLLAGGWFSDIQTATEELDYYYPNLDSYWEEDVMSTMRRIPLDILGLATAERVRAEHFKESVLR